MSKFSLNVANEPMSSFEYNVMEALKELPDNYSILESTRLISFKDDSADYIYKPDFIVRDDLTGNRLLIEVKSEFGLSLANISQLSKITNSENIQENEDLLILVWTESNLINKYSSLSNLKKLNVSFVKTVFDVTKAVLARFTSLKQSNL